MRTVRNSSVFSLILMCLAMTNVHAALPTEVEGQPLPSLASMVEKVQASMVRIAVQTRATARRDPFDDPFFRRFFDSRRGAKRTREMFTTGVVVDAERGFILANESAVRGANKIKVTLSDGREVDGSVLGSDATTNVAVIKVSVAGLAAIELGNSDDLRVGDFVVSIGDPLGTENTLVTGLVSALAEKNSLQAYQNFIRSDAAVGPGVLVDLNGSLVGLNIAKSATTAGSARVGFATPVNMAMRVKQQVLDFGTPQRGFLAVQIQDLTSSLAQAFSIEQKSGAVITSVNPGSTAEVAGLEVGDVVLEIDRQAINRGNDLRNIIGQHFAGDTLDMTVARQGQTINLAPILESSTSPSRQGQMIHFQLEGATFKDSETQAVSTATKQGVRVSSVEQGSVAWRHGVRTNDLIVAANRKPVANLDGLRSAISGEDVLMLNIVRDSGALFLLMQ